jgi:hypothetical protein
MLKTRADPVSRISGRAETYKAHRLSGELEVAMDHRDILERIFSSNAFIADREICSTRRGLLLAPLLAALPLALSQTEALADKIDPAETQIRLHCPTRSSGAGQAGLPGSTSSNWTGAIPKRPMTAGPFASFFTPS